MTIDRDGLTLDQLAKSLNAGDTGAQYYNVRALPYGAEGNGTTNDAPSFQAAIDAAYAAGGGTVYAPPGAYRLTSPLTMRSGVALMGDALGTVLELGANIGATGKALLSIGAVSGVTIRDLKIDMKSATYTTTSNSAIGRVDTDSGAHRIIVENVTIEDSAGYGISFLAKTAAHDAGISIINCRIENCGSHGIICQDYVDDVTVEGCYVGRWGLTVDDRIGICVGRSGTNNVVVNNTVVHDGVGSTPKGTSPHGISVDLCLGVVVSNNIVRAKVGFGIEVGFSTQVTVTGNTVYPDVRCGIGIDGNLADGQARDVAVVGNVISGGAAQGIYIYGVSGAVVRNVVVSGNTIRGVGTIGIEVDYADDIHLADNLICDTTQSGIFIDASLTGDVGRCTVIDNTIYGCNSSAHASHGGLRINTAAPPKTYRVAGNKVTASGTRDYFFTQAGTLISERFLANTAEPSVAMEDAYETQNSVATDLTDLLDHTTGQLVTIRAGDALTTLKQNPLKMVLAGALDHTMAVGETVTLRDIGGVWYEVARSGSYASFVANALSIVNPTEADLYLTKTGAGAGSVVLGRNATQLFLNSDTGAGYSALATWTLATKALEFAGAVTAVGALTSQANVAVTHATEADLYLQKTGASANVSYWYNNGLTAGFNDQTGAHELLKFTLATGAATFGAYSVTAGTFIGNLTGNASGSAATVTGATQTAITTCANLVTVGALNAGSITSGFGSIDIGADALTAGQGTLSGLTFSANAYLVRNTADGSDNGYVGIAGGGTGAVTRGAEIAVYGNEHAIYPGVVEIAAGNVAGGVIDFYSGAGAKRWTISAAGALNATGAMAILTTGTLGCGALTATTGTFSDTLLLTGSAATASALAVTVTGDGTSRWLMRSDGAMSWGSGAATRDVWLYRSAANTLKIDADFANGAANLILAGGLTAATITLSASGFLARNTADAADTGYLGLAGGGAGLATRGAYIIAYGNEHASTGDLALVAGNVAGGDIEFYTANTLRLTLPYAGGATFAAGVTGTGVAAFGPRGALAVTTGGMLQTSSNLTTVAYLASLTAQGSAREGFLFTHTGSDGYYGVTNTLVIAGEYYGAGAYRPIAFVTSNAVRWTISTAGALNATGAMAILTTGTLGCGALTATTISGTVITASTNLAVTHATEADVYWTKTGTGASHTVGFLSATQFGFNNDISGGYLSLLVWTLSTRNAVFPADVTATTFIGALTGNCSGSSGSCTGLAATATALATPRAINGVNFDGTAAITVTAAAGTLTGTTLNAAVVTSSLTTVGPLNAGSITNGFGAIDVGADAISGGVITASTNVAVAVADAGAYLYLQRVGGASASTAALYDDGTNIGLNDTGNSRTLISFAVASGACTIPQSLTIDGGLVSYGANDSAGAGYRWVRVPNV